MRQTPLVRMDLMSSRDVQAYLARNDMVILPVGCFEMHGPEIPLACDALVAWGQSLLLAETWGCLALPPVYYTFPGASGPWPGTVELSTAATRDYIAAIVEALLRGGFRRVVLCGGHAPLRAILECVVRDPFQRTGRIVLHLRPNLMPAELVRRELNCRPGEDLQVLAALKLLGQHGAYEPRGQVDKPPETPFASLTQLWQWGATLPWTFSAGHQHTGLRRGLRLEDADKAIAIMRQTAAAMRDFPAVFARYQEEMEALYRERPWARSDIWTLAPEPRADAEGQARSRPS